MVSTPILIDLLQSTQVKIMLFPHVGPLDQRGLILGVHDIQSLRASQV